LSRLWCSAAWCSWEAQAAAPAGPGEKEEEEEEGM
jgi:hypothetical protein